MRHPAGFRLPLAPLSGKLEEVQEKLKQRGRS
jgi:hypothetical protein